MMNGDAWYIFSAHSEEIYLYPGLTVFAAKEVLLYALNVSDENLALC